MAENICVTVSLYLLCLHTYIVWRGRWGNHDYHVYKWFNEYSIYEHTGYSHTNDTAYYNTYYSGNQWIYCSSSTKSKR